MDKTGLVTPVFPGQKFTSPPELSDNEIQMIHARLEVPGPEQIHSMAREIRKWRGVPDPDAI